MKKSFACAALTLAASATAFAHPNHDRDAPAAGTTPPAAKSATRARAVAIEMRDGACLPREIKAAPGESLRLVGSNKDARPQDLAVGSAKDLKGQAEMIRKFPQMTASAASRVSVQPGQSAELVWQPPAGEALVACAAAGEFDPAKTAKVVTSR